jgi:predicted O-methyltransferase YrrM
MPSSQPQADWPEIDRYFDGRLLTPDPMLDAANAAAHAAGLPDIQVAPNQGKLLQLLALAVRAQRVLEIGTLAGYSTIWLARALSKGGRVVTLEADPKHAAVARENIERAGLAGTVEVVLGPALETLPTLQPKPPFDLVFIDADKSSSAAYFEHALRLSRPGSLIVVDNVVRSGRVVDANSGDASVEGVRRLVELVASEPRVSATALQTVGCKGHDGFLLALVLSTEAPPQSEPE